MKEQKKGISLIVLVITIIVMLILASAVIISLSNSNIITKAKEAVLKTDVKNFAGELSVSLAEQKLNNKDLEFDNVTETDVEEIKKYIPNFDEKYAGKIFIQNGELVYNASNVTENEKAALESIGIKSGTTYTPAEIKAIIEEKNLGADVSTTDITKYVEGISKKEAEKYTIFKGQLCYRYEKTTYEEQLELHSAEICCLLADANGDGLLNEDDVTIISKNAAYENMDYEDSIWYIGNISNSPDIEIDAEDVTNLEYIISSDFITNWVSIERQNPARIKLHGDYLINFMKTLIIAGINTPSDLNTTDYEIMKEYYPYMTEEQAERFAVVDGELVYREETLTDSEKAWADEASIPYV